jgi:hypothetical protein
MTLLSICQDVADDVGISKPTIIVGNTDETARRLLAQANAALKSLGKSNNWLELVTEYTFSTVASQEDYSLPSDFGRMENQTLWDRSNYESLRGPLSPQLWQEYKSSILASTVTTWKKYRIRNVSGTVKFSIHPTPDSVENLVFEYVSNNFCESSGGTGQTEWNADTDVGILDEYLIFLGTRWRMMRRLGMSYAEEKKEYEDELEKAWGRNGSSPMLNLAGRKRFHLIGSDNIPETGYGS